MRLFQAARDTPLDSPSFASLSVHGLHFTVYTPSKGFATLKSRLSFPATEPPDPTRVSEGFSEGVSEGVSEGSLKGFRRVSEGLSQGPF